MTALAENVGTFKFLTTDGRQFLDCIEKYRELYKDRAPTISDMLLGILVDSGYEEELRSSGEDERLENVEELKRSIYDYETTAGEQVFLDDYLQDIALYTSADKDKSSDSVKMMTTHNAKGLEFKYVFVVGLNEGIFPSRKSYKKEQMEEERRLAYVAFTRAENQLFLSDAEGHHFACGFRYPSRFIFNTEKVGLDYVVELDEGFERVALQNIEADENRTKRIEINRKLSVGTNITHPSFGRGIIIEKNNENQEFVVKFENCATHRTITFEAVLIF